MGIGDGMGCQRVAEVTITKSCVSNYTTICIQELISNSDINRWDVGDSMFGLYQGFLGFVLESPRYVLQNITRDSFDYTHTSQLLKSIWYCLSLFLFPNLIYQLVLSNLYTLTCK